MQAVVTATDGAGAPYPRLVELPDPVPQAGEVLVAVEAAGINHADLLQIAGRYPPPLGESAVPGLECAGRVARRTVGALRTWEAGERVMALLGGGGHGTLAAIPEAQLLPVPERLSIVEAGAIPEAGLTAWTNLVAEGGLKAGESVLVTGATGGMGSFTVQLARELGARVIASARSREGLERLRELGIEELVPAGADLAQRVRERTGGRGVDLVFDLVGGAQLPAHLDALADRGRLVLVGLLAGGTVEVALHTLLRRRLRLIGSVLRYRSRAEKTELVRGFGDFALPRLADGRLRAVISRVVPFADVALAYAELAKGAGGGKIVLDMRG